MKPGLCRAVCLATVLGAVSGVSARAGSIDLTKAGSSGTANGALFMQTDLQPTGTGVLDPFVRIQMTGTERGYNTDARPVEFDTKDQNQWTHSLDLNSLALETIGGTGYYKFGLDINEPDSPTGRFLSLDNLEVHLGNSPSLTGYNNGFGANSVSVYNLDSGGDNTIELNAKLGHGSGSGDMFAYIPASYFSGQDSSYRWVYLYSAFGTPNASGGGFEEWAASVGPVEPQIVQTPTPSALVLAGVGLACVAGRTLRRKPSPA